MSYNCLWVQKQGMHGPTCCIRHWSKTIIYQITESEKEGSNLKNGSLHCHGTHLKWYEKSQVFENNTVVK